MSRGQTQTSRTLPGGPENAPQRPPMSPQKAPGNSFDSPKGATGDFQGLYRRTKNQTVFRGPFDPCQTIFYGPFDRRRRGPSRRLAKGGQPGHINGNRRHGPLGALWRPSSGLLEALLGPSWRPLGTRCRPPLARHVAPEPSWSRLETLPTPSWSLFRGPPGPMWGSFGRVRGCLSLAVGQRSSKESRGEFQCGTSLAWSF